MAFEALNFVDGVRSVGDIFRAVAAEADAAGTCTTAPSRWKTSRPTSTRRRTQALSQWGRSAAAAGRASAKPKGKDSSHGRRGSTHRWDEIALEKVTEVISRKIVTGEKEMLSQIYLKRGAVVPMHKHEAEQLTYVLQGSLRFRGRRG